MKSLFKNSMLQEEVDRKGYVIIPFLHESQIHSLRRLYEESINQASVSDLYESSRHNSLERNQQINQAIHAELEHAGKDIFNACQLYGGTFMVKSHEKSTMLPAHQDWSIVEEDEYNTLFIWCPLQDVTALNGGLFVLEGSHKYFDVIRSGTYPSNRYILPYSLHHCVKDISLRAGEAILYSDQVLHGSHSNQGQEDRVVVTGQIIEQGARLVYFQKKNEEEVDIYPADQAFYLSHINFLAKGQLPPGLSKLYSRAYRHRAITNESLQARLNENFPVAEQRSVECQLFKDELLQQTFDRDGYVVIDFIDPEQVEELTGFYRGLDHAPMPEYGFQVSLDNNQGDFVRTISDKLKQTLKPYVDRQFQNHQIFTASFVVKEKNPLGVVPPHQDWTFVDEYKYWSATIWCPLIDVDMHNGGLGVIQGSHLFYDHVRPSPSPQYEPPFKNHIRSIFPYLKIIELKAGQALVFNNRTFHASLPNTTDHSRIAFGLGITHRDAEIQHFYLLPDQEKVLVERYEVSPDFFHAYNNARLSAMHQKGERPHDLNITGLFEYTHRDYETAELVEVIEAAGNVRNDKLIEAMAALFNYNLDGTAKDDSGAPLTLSPSEPLWKTYAPKNIYREIRHRIINRHAGESLWKFSARAQIVSELKHRIAKKTK